LTDPLPVRHQEDGGIVVEVPTGPLEPVS
jgi:hypothetical protein